MVERNMEAVYKQKTLDAAANNIWDELKKIRISGEDDKKKYMKRWIWELIQNASDCTREGKKINIKVDFDGESMLIFEHDGVGFNRENLVDIVTQISSKQSSKEEKTGQFGTGFISTNLLCEKITIESNLSESDKSFKLILDRSAKDYESLKNAIEKNLNDIDSVAQYSVERSAPDRTKFIYDLKFSDNIQSSKESVLKGIQVLEANIPYLLAFNDNIDTITVNGSMYTIRNIIKLSTNNYQKIVATKDNVIYQLLLKIHTEKFQIALPYESIDSDNNSIDLIKKINKNISKIYCNFPLIGTETFPFPLVLNSSFFEVEKDRDKVREGDKGNLEIFDDVITEYRLLLSILSRKHIKRLYNVCLEHSEGGTNFEISFREKIQRVYTTIPLVEGVDGKFHCINDDQGKVNVLIPKDKSGQPSEEVWNLAMYLNDINIPTKESFVFWSEVINSTIALKKIHSKYLVDKTIDSFKEKNGAKDVFKWLVDFYNLYMKSYPENYQTTLFAPNQNNTFVNLSTLKSDNNIDSDLKVIRKMMGKDINENLLSRDLILPEELFIEVVDDSLLAKEIQKEGQLILLDEATREDNTRAEEIQIIFSKLFLYFSEKPEISVTLFPNLYPQRMQLQTKEENIRILKIADQIKNSKITDKQFDELLDEDNGILSILKNPDIPLNKSIEQLYHKTNNSIYARGKIDILINRTVRNVHEYLSKNQLYKVEPTVEEWKNESQSSTVFTALKGGSSINIVVRPCDDDKIIFYGDEELIAFHDNFELWIDNGKDDPKNLTLGDLLTITGITTFPLRNLFKEKEK